MIKLTNKQKKEIIYYWKYWVPVYKIAKRYKISQTWVYKLAKKSGQVKDVC